MALFGRTAGVRVRLRKFPEANQTFAPSHVADAISVLDGENQRHCVRTTLVPTTVPPPGLARIRKKIGTSSLAPPRSLDFFCGARNRTKKSVEEL